MLDFLLPDILATPVFFGFLPAEPEFFNYI
jgi:hypothetical protein